METTTVKDINGNTFSWSDGKKVIHTLHTDGILAICHRSGFEYEANSLNAAHAVQRGGRNLGVIPRDCIQTSNILDPASFPMIYIGQKTDDDSMLENFYLN
jgi:hypothetical protein